MVGCPVDWCDYENSPGSVAGHVSGMQDEDHDWEKLGYDGIWEFRNQFEPGSKEGTSILHMTDSHIGRQYGGYYGTTWDVDCANGFQRAIERAIELGVDAVLHTGDLFHNDRNGITESQSAHVGSRLEDLSKADIPFFYILGDHERDEGKVTMREFEQIGYAENLEQNPVNVGKHVALYGQNYQPPDFWKQKNWKPESPGDRFSILALHQSIAPFTGKDHPDLHVKNIHTWTAISDGFLFDAIALGQFHREFDEKSANTRVICGGATERLGKTKSSIDPSVGVFQVTADGVEYRRHYL